MRLALYGSTALQLWRACDVADRRLAAQNDITPDFVPSLTRPEYHYLVSRFGMRGEICSLAGSDEARRNSQLLRCYTNSSSQPTKLVHLGKQLYISSPCYTIAQLASTLSVGASKDDQKRRSSTIILSAIISELAGNYRLAPNFEAGFREAQPLVTLESIYRMLETTSRFPGREIVRKALDYSVENSNSPAEVQLALFEIMPKAWGGGGMPKPVLNRRIITNVGSLKKSRYADLCWEQEKRIIEYNGGYHEGERANDDDARRNALIARGYTVNVINKSELHNANILDGVLQDVAKCVGSEGRRTSDFESRRALMRSLVFETCDTACYENRGYLVPDTLKVAPYTPTRV